MRSQTGKTLLDWLGSNQLPPLGCREVWDWANTYGFFLGRFHIVGSSIHSSATCLVIFAFDLKHDKQNPAPVALKLMRNEKEWQREQEMRRLNQDQLDCKRVLELLDAVDLEQDAGDMDPRLKGEHPYRYMVTMQRGKHDLNHHLSHYRVAGRNRKQVIKILRQVAQHLKLKIIENATTACSRTTMQRRCQNQKMCPKPNVRARFPKDT